MSVYLNVGRNFSNMKILIVCCGFLTAIGCGKNELKIIPLSPYEQTVSYTGRDKTTDYFFALKNYSPNKKTELDSFVRRHVPQNFLKSDRNINIWFYQYEKGHIDENFIHQEQPKQQNLFIEAGAILLVHYSWQWNKFIGVYYFDSDEVTSESRNW